MRSTRERLLLVATDRVSAFDVVMRETVPYKGAVLTQISAWWLRQLGTGSPHHMLTADVDEIVGQVPVLRDARDHARRPRHVVPPDGSLSRRMRRPRLHRGVGVEGVPRLRNAGRRTAARRAAESEPLPSPIFSPATKAESGHDENITRATMA